MKFYICKFLYISNKSSHSANVPDDIRHICIIQSDIDLKNVKLYQIKKYYRIEELLDENDCDDISLEEIDFESVKDDYSDDELIIINKENL